MIQKLERPPIKILYLVVVLLIVLGILAYRIKVAKEISSKAVHSYHQGNAFVKQGKFAEAAPYYKEAIQLNPKYFDAYNNLANVLVSEGKAEEAIPHYRKAIELNPNYLEARNNLGIALASLSKLDDAIQVYTEALKLFPKSPDLHNSYGTILAQQGKTKEAAVQFSEALKLRPDFEKAKQNLELINAAPTPST